MHLFIQVAQKNVGQSWFSLQFGLHAVIYKKTNIIDRGKLFLNDKRVQHNFSTKKKRSKETKMVYP